MNDFVAERIQECRHRLTERQERLKDHVPLSVQGRLNRMVGLTLEAVGCQAAVGDRCLIMNQPHNTLEAEVVGFSGEQLYLMSTAEVHGLSPNARVLPLGRSTQVRVGEALLGRILDGNGAPLDHQAEIESDVYYPLKSSSINPLLRKSITEPLDVGVRTINSLLTVGRGQRLGLFAPSGVGKSVLMGMMARYTEADVIVVGMIGERGREVNDFIEQNLGPEGRARSVVVATPASETPLMRLHGAYVATSIAEYFRDKGKNVLLLMDSLTRFAQAQREIALTIGEPPATKGYPPSVFTLIPQLIERAGNADGPGSITALYTVLTEGEDRSDPVAESARAILDGHIVLSRRMAESGIYPAIDIEASISRTMSQICTESQINQAVQFKQFYSLYEQNRDLINIGAYNAGSDAGLDLAIRANPLLKRFLQQSMHEKVSYEDSQKELEYLMSAIQQQAQHNMSADSQNNLTTT